MKLFVNQFSCLSNTLIQRCLALSLPVTFSVPIRTRKLVRKECVAASDIAQVRLHQCPQEDHVRYCIYVQTKDGRQWSEEFVDHNDEQAHDTFVLYDRDRDGVVQYIHVVH